MSHNRGDVEYLLVLRLEILDLVAIELHFGFLFDFVLFLVAPRKTSRGTWISPHGAVVTLPPTAYGETTKRSGKSLTNRSAL